MALPNRQHKYKRTLTFVLSYKLPLDNVRKFSPDTCEWTEWRWLAEQIMINIMIAWTARASRLYEGYDIRRRVYFGPTSISIQFTPTAWIESCRWKFSIANVDLGYHIMALKLSWAGSAVAMSTLSSRLIRFWCFGECHDEKLHWFANWKNMV